MAIGTTYNELSLSRTLRMIETTGWRPSCIIDVGVAMGTHGLYDVWPDADILLVDPVPANLPFMQKIAARHERVQIFNVGASNTTGEMFARIAENGQAVLGQHTKKTGWVNATLPVMTVDKIVAQSKARGPYLLKIDTDTHEREVLEGAQETLRWADVVVIEAGIFNHMKGKFPVSDLWDVLYGCDFALFDIAHVGRNETGIESRASSIWYS